MIAERSNRLPAMQPLVFLVVALAGAPILTSNPVYAQPNLQAATDKDFGEVIPLDPASGKPLNEVPFDVDFYFSLPKGAEDLSVEYRLMAREYDDSNCELLLASSKAPVMAGPAIVAGPKFLLQMPPLSPSQRYCLGIEKSGAVTTEAMQKPGFMAALRLATDAAVEAVGLPVPALAHPTLVSKVNQAIARLNLPVRFRLSAIDLQAALDQAREKLRQRAADVSAVALEMQDEHRLIQRALNAPSGAEPCPSEYKYCKQTTENQSLRSNPNSKQLQVKTSEQWERYAHRMASYSQWVVRQVENGELVLPGENESAIPESNSQQLEPAPGANAGGASVEGRSGAPRPVPRQVDGECADADERCKKVKDLFALLEEALKSKVQLDGGLSIPQLSTVGGLTVRRNQFLSFDIGYGAAPDIGETFYYAAIGIYLRPINKNAPLNPKLVGDKRLFSRAQLLRRLSFVLGITETISASSEAARLKGVVDGGKRPLLLGINLRVTEALSVGAGGLLFKVVSPNPLDTHEDLRFTPFISLSLNGDLRALFGSLVDAFSH